MRGSCQGHVECDQLRAGSFGESREIAVGNRFRRRLERMRRHGLPEEAFRAAFNVDLGLHKQFRLPGEGHNLEFRSEVFNALNKTNFSPAGGDRSTSSFGTISSTLPARQVQLALKLMF